MTIINISDINLSRSESEGRGICLNAACNITWWYNFSLLRGKGPRGAIPISGLIRMDLVSLEGAAILDCIAARVD